MCYVLSVFCFVMVWFVCCIFVVFFGWGWVFYRCSKFCLSIPQYYADYKRHKAMIKSGSTPRSNDVT